MRFRAAVVTLSSLLVALAALAVHNRPTIQRNVSGRHEVSAPAVKAFAVQPLMFEENQGQMNPQALFRARSAGGSVFVTSAGATFSLAGDLPGDTRLPKTGVRPDEKVRTRLEPAAFRMTVLGARGATSPVGTEKLPGKVNYFIGNDRSKWHTDIPTFSKVSVRGVYPGIDLVYYGSNEGQLEYDFVVAPGANSNAIRVGFEGVDRIRINKDGDLILAVGGREVIQRRPRVYQESNGSKRELGSAYVVLANQEVAFRVEGRDQRHAMVIDPALVYSTYLGGAGGTILGDSAKGIAVDANGNAYVTGIASSTNFPTASPVQAAIGGNTDVFISKINAAGTGLVYSTYLGGSDGDSGSGVAVDASGNAYVTGITYSQDFPTASPLQATKQNGVSNAFVAKINAAGSSLIYSTYLGGSGNDAANSIAVDATGNAYVAGGTSSVDFPTVSPIYRASGAPTDAFVAKINAAGTGLVYSTYLGGSNAGRVGTQAQSIAVDGSGNAYVAGSTYASNFPTVNAIQAARSGTSDAFVAKVNAAGSGFVYCTYLGGSGDDTAFGVAVDASGNAFVAGVTSSTDFPTVSPVQATYGGTFDVFVTKIKADGTAMVYSTYLGGSKVESSAGIAIDGSGNAYVVGLTLSTNFPSVSPIQAVIGGGEDAFLAKINAAGNGLIYSTYLGGSANDEAKAVAVDVSGNAYVSGLTASANFPTASPIQAANSATGSSSAFVAKISATLALTLTGVSPNSGVPLGGTTVTLVGGNFPGNAQVSFGGVAATNVTVINASRLTAVTPAHALGAVDVTITGGGDIATLSGGFTYEYPPLTLSAITPGVGPIAGGTTVTLSGASFPADAQVTFGGIAATSVVFVSASELTAVTPAHAAGAVDVTVTGNAQTATLTGAFAYGIPPVISSISPATGSSAGATEVTITGTGFQTGATVKFGTTAAESVTFVNSTTITAVTPSLPAGAVDVSVTNPDGQTSTLPGAFTFWTQQKHSGCSTGGADSLLALLLAAAAVRGVGKRNRSALRLSR